MPALTFALMLFAVLAAATLTVVVAALLGPYVGMPLSLLSFVALAAVLLVRRKRQ